MRKALFALVAALGLLLAFPVAAAADHTTGWSGNEGSHVVDATTVHLEGKDTSVETGNLNLTVTEGEPVSFEYELHGDLECGGSALQVWFRINGTNHHSHELAPDYCVGDAGTVEFEIPDSGLITNAAVIQDQRPDDGEGHTIVSNLTIDGEPIHFMNPEPEPTVIDLTEPAFTDATCDESGTRTLAKDKGVKWIVDSERVKPGTVEVDTGKHKVAAVARDGYVFDAELYSEGDPLFEGFVAKAKDCETATPEPEPTETEETTTPVASTGEELPATGGRDALWMLLGVGLLMVGAGVGTIIKRRMNR